MHALVPQLIASGQDHEFYPTTDEIIAAFIADLKREVKVERGGFWKGRYQSYESILELNERGLESVLDVGAGHGKVLTALKEDEELPFEKFFAIEMAPLLIQHLPDYVFTIGTNFHEQSLWSKPVSVLFCNPPYSEYANWTCRIIREAAASEIYLVIPRRWKDRPDIAAALKHRAAEAVTVGSFDFEDAEDRRARAKVDLLRIDLPKATADEAFERFFHEEFADLIKVFGEEEDDKKKSWQQQEDAKAAEHNRRFGSLVPGDDYAARMVQLYCDEMKRIQHHCQLISGLDAGMMKEFGITPASILTCLREKLKKLKHVYWHELFDRLTTITDRLTSKSRECFLGTLRENVHVDFTLGNIQAILLWVVRNANRYLDSQLIDTYEQMVESCNVKLYQSNKRPFAWNRWRYNDGKEPNSTHLFLEYRIVCHYIGGIRKTQYSFEKGLEERAIIFLRDLLTIARNLGFNCQTTDNRLGHYGKDKWKSGQVQEFRYADAKGFSRVLIEVRAFYNGNLHLRLDQDLALALNVEYGRLKGWLRSGGEACMELKDLKARSRFKSNHQLQLTASSVLALL